MNIAGTKLTSMIMKTYHNGNNQVGKGNKALEKANQMIKTAADNYQNKPTYTESVKTQTNVQVLSDSKRLENEMAVSVIDTADDGLSATESLLRKMAELVNAYNDPTKQLSSTEKEELNQQLQELLKELNKLSDGNPMLDGTFGGVLGEDGILGMGIDEITSTGNIDGKLKLNIEANQNGVKITARIGDKEVTNELRFSDTETVFDFGNTKLSLKFANGAGNLKSGSIKNIMFSIGSKNADLRNAVSRDKSVSDIYTNGTNGQNVKIPDLLDVSAAGLGLNGMKINSLSDAKNALAKLNETLKRIGYTRNHLAEARTAITGFSARG